MLKPTPADESPDQQCANAHCMRALFVAEESPLLRYAFSIVGRRAVAEDIVQEVFLQLHSKWGSVASPRAWLYRSVRNRALNHIRDHQRELLSGGDAAAETQDESGETPESRHLRIEATGVLRGLIDELDEQDRRLVELKYFEELKYREISEKTGLSIGNVGYRLHHILRELASKLRPLGIDEQS